MTVCKPLDSNKIYQFFGNVNLSTILENISKYDVSDLKEDNYSVVPLQQKKKRKKNLFKKNSTTVIFLEFSEFFQNRHKEQLLTNSSGNIK